MSIQSAPASAGRGRRSIAALSFVQVALFLVPVIVLGQAINWPASLRLPPADALPLIARNQTAVMIGYGGYLLASLALIPLAFALRQWLKDRGSDSSWVDAMTFVGAASGVLKTLGIVRWLTVMPLLAASYVDPATDAATKRILEISYLSINSYAGGVGELLGVQLLGGIWTGYIAVALWLRGFRITGAVGVVASALLVVLAFRIFMPSLGGLLAIAGPLGLLWFTLLGIAMLRSKT